MQCNPQLSEEYVFGKYNQQDGEETSGQIYEESEHHIPNDVGEEAHVNNNRE